METTERIVEATVRYMKRWATIPNAMLTISEFPVGYYRSGIELPPIIHLRPLCLFGRFGLSYPARRRTFQIHNLRAGYIQDGT
jgi:hypothetical protein